MAFLSKYQPQLLSILRIVAGLLFLEHGTQKILGFPAMPPEMAAAITPDHHMIIMVAGYIELIGGALLFLGVFTRIVAFICSGEMAFAYWLGHFPKSPFPAVNEGDAAILFCFVFLFIAAAGPGPIALSPSSSSR